MGIKRSVVVVLATMGCISVTVGCYQKNRMQAVSETFMEIGVVTKSRNSEYWMSVCSGMEKAASELGVTLTFLHPDHEYDLKTQKLMVEDLIKKKVDAIAISTSASYDNDDYVELAEAAGIPVYSYDTKISDCDVPYIGADNYWIGYELARTLADHLEHKGEVGIVSGVDSQDSHRNRTLGFQAYMETEPEMVVVFVERGYSNLRMSEHALKLLEEEYPELKGIMATSAVTALGIAEGLNESEILVVTVDAQEDAIQALKEGKITALAAQSGYDIGYETISYIVADHQGEVMEKEKILPTEILTNLKK